MYRYLNLSVTSVFVIVFYIQITYSQSINSAETTNNDTESKIEINTTEPNSKPPAFRLKPILYDNEELEYEDFLSRNPQRIEIKSVNYPDPYPGNSDFSRSLTAELGTGVDIIIHDLDLNPVSDYLYIRGDNDNENGVLYTGKPVDLPIRIRILSTNSFFYQFEASAANANYRGFLLTYAAYGDIPVTTEKTTTEFPINDLTLQFMTVHLGIPVDQQTNETWAVLRTVFSDMANKYIKSQNISAAESQPDYVVFQSIKTCPSSWRDAENCVSVEFALPVPIIKIDEDDKELQYKVNRTNFDYELTEPKLKEMWDMYAEMALEGKGIVIFEKQNSLVLLMWIGVSLAVITAFLIVLYCIWRMDELNAYRRFRNKRSDSIVPENTAKPSTMEEQAPYYQEPPSLFDEDLNGNNEQMYAANTTISNNNLFVIDDDDDMYPTNRQSFHQPSNRVHNTNGVPKSALKNPQSNMMPPPQYTDKMVNHDDDDDRRIIISTESSLPARPQQLLFLPDVPTLKESNS